MSASDKNAAMASPSSSTFEPNARLQSRLGAFGVTCGKEELSSLHTDTISADASNSSSTFLLPPTASHRSLHACQDFPAGSLILRSTPHSFVLTPLACESASTAQGRAKCEYCGLGVGDTPQNGAAPVAKLLRCSLCKLSSYCTQSCQKLAWKSFHAFECKQIYTNEAKVKLLNQLAPEAKMDLLLLGRCVRKRGKEAADVSLRHPSESQLELELSVQAPLQSSFEDLEAMESHYAFIEAEVDRFSASSSSSSNKKKAVKEDDNAARPALPESAVLGMAQRLADNNQLLSIGFRLALFGSEIGPKDVSALLLPLLTSFQSNNFAIQNSLLLPQGAGVYPLGALLDHSCEPNCVVTYEPVTLKDSLGKSHEFKHVQSIRTIREVKKGEELTHAYIDTCSVTSKRRAALEERYYFLCRCIRCTRDEQGKNPFSSENFLERDRDGNQLPEEILKYEYGEEGKDGSASSSSKSTLPSSRYKALQKANKFWSDATTLHMKENTAKTPEAYEAEEVRRNKHEQVLISSALQLRLEHLHPYSIQLLSTLSKLLHICLLNQDYPAAIHACEQLCMKYRMIYGTEAIRVKELQRLERQRKNPDSEAEEDELPSNMSSFSSSSLPIHPLLGLQLYTLASIYAETQQALLAQKTYESSYDILKLTHGTTHELVVRLQNEIDEQAKIVSTGK